MTDATTKKARTRPQAVQLDAIKVDPKATSAHFARWEGDIRALDARDVLTANVNITRALVIVLGALPNLMNARDEIVATLSNFRVAALDDLSSLGYAAWHAYLQQRMTDDPSQSCADIMPEAESLRETLLTSAQSQVKRKNIPQSVINEVLPGKGIEDRANDLTILAKAFRQSWTKIDGKTDVQLAELDRAEELAITLLARLALRAVPARKEGALDEGQIRARAFTLFANAYEECRRGAAALWWYEPGGWEQYVPSLRSGQGGRSRASTTGSDEDPAPVPTPDPKPEDNTDPAGKKTEPK